MTSTILELLAECEWDIDDLLSSKNYRHLAISELSAMEGYIKGLEWMLKFYQEKDNDPQKRT